VVGVERIAAVVVGVERAGAGTGVNRAVVVGAGFVVGIEGLFVEYAGGEYAGVLAM
jgi:hypothetical protein